VPRWDNAPQVHSRVSDIYFDIWKQIVEGGLHKYPIKKYQRRNILTHFGLNLTVFPGSLTDLSA
jgi:hypothetical protein